MVGARRLARPRLPDSESGGSAIPREPRADEIGVPDRLRSGGLLHERQACWLDYTTGTFEFTIHDLRFKNPTNHVSGS